MKKKNLYIVVCTCVVWVQAQTRSLDSIQYLDEQMYDWDFTLLYESEFTKVSQRYTLAETDKTLNELKDKLKKS